MVTEEEGLAFAEESGCLFLESSAKTRENVEKCFEELALKVCLEKDITAWAANVPIVRYLMAPFTPKLETLICSD